MLRNRCVAANEILLNDDGAADCLDRAVEDGDKAIAGSLDQNSMVFCNRWLDEITLDPLDARMRAFLVLLHEPAVARDVAGNDCRKPSRHRAAWRMPILPRFEVANFPHAWVSTNLQMRLSNDCPLLGTPRLERVQ